jgi:beta-glucanase (GH16 family)
LASFEESFDNGLGALSHTWTDGGHIDTGSGQVTLKGEAIAMMHPGGSDTGFGYGKYEFEASMSPDQKGPAILLWPGDDKWPGPEYDIVEVIDGHAYGAVHWNDNGHDAYTTRTFDGVDESQTHTYGITWQEGRIDYYVDGQHYGSVTENVGNDHAHGGVNMVPSIMSGGDAELTVYKFTYDAVW